MRVFFVLILKKGCSSSYLFSKLSEKVEICYVDLIRVMDVGVFFWAIFPMFWIRSSHNSLPNRSRKLKFSMLVLDVPYRNFDSSASLHLFTAPKNVVFCRVSLFLAYFSFILSIKTKILWSTNLQWVGEEISINSVLGS